MFQIEKGLPIPATATKSLIRSTYPFRLMEVGDSVWVEGDKAVQTRAITNARGVGKKDSKEFVFEQAQDGVRIWRSN